MNQPIGLFRGLPAWLGLLVLPLLGGCAWGLQAYEAVTGDGEPLALPSPALAKRALYKAGPEVKLVTGDRYDGLLYGARAVRHLAFHRPAYYGVMAYGALPGGVGEDVSPLFGYAGLLAGYEGELLAWPFGEAPAWTGFAGRHPALVGYDLNLHLGLTRELSGELPAPVRSNLSLEPSVALSVPVPFYRGGRLALSAGYLYLPAAPGYSAWTFGVHLDHKTFEVATPIE